jgi:hypothetical protein
MACKITQETRASKRLIIIVTKQTWPERTTNPEFIFPTQITNTCIISLADSLKQNLIVQRSSNTQILEALAQD